MRLYDMPSFDPAYATPPLEHYEPLLASFFAAAPVERAEGPHPPDHEVLVS